MLQRYFLRYQMTESLGDKLSGNEMQEANLYINKYRYRSIPRYSQSSNQKSGSRCLRCLKSWSLITNDNDIAYLQKNLREQKIY